MFTHTAVLMLVLVQSREAVAIMSDANDSDERTTREVTGVKEVGVGQGQQGSSMFLVERRALGRQSSNGEIHAALFWMVA